MCVCVCRCVCVCVGVCVCVCDGDGEDEVVVFKSASVCRLSIIVFIGCGENSLAARFIGCFSEA